MIDRFTYINSKVPHDEPVFILRAQDKYAAHLVLQWAILLNNAGGNFEKVKEALQISKEMSNWPTQKLPD
jgi:hypothetical protein